MKSSTFKVLLAFFVYSILLVEASPFNTFPFRRQNGLQRKGAAKGTGAGATKSAAGTGTGKTSAVAGTATTSAAKTKATTALNATVLDCQIVSPPTLLDATGLSTPWQLSAPCSMLVATQQAFAEAAVYDPTTNTVSIYHPLIINEGTTPAAAPVVPVIPAGATVALWFGFNGGVLKLVDANGLDTNNSPILKGSDCINGLAGTQNDVFGQVSWCNAQAFFAAVNTGKPTIPPLGVDNNGNACPTSRSFELVDACPSDNVPTQYLLLPNGQTAQDTAANRAANPTATVINNASDEALLTNILDPLIGCTPFKGASLDDPGVMVPALALSEMQADALQLPPIGLVPLNDPDCLLTSSGTVSTQKTNQYRLGVNQPIVAAGNDSGALDPYCTSMLSVAPPFLKGFETLFLGQTTPAACVGNNLFTFLCQRLLTSLTQLTCPVAQEVIPISCAQDGNGVATSCTINLTKTALGTGAGTAATATATSKAKGGAGSGTGATTATASAATATGKATGGGGANPKPSKVIGMG